ncbi:MAG TPA: YggS family pyridoxal phosphate-dependent enzyme [Nocardioidaceae bacterium]|nr:YggS family pyridoxal phosphate-dependent enzyme [Nocardioidaceae bacterium]
MADEERAEQLRVRLAAVHARIADAAASAGRARDDVTLVVVTKTWPASDIRALHDLGVRDIGENRHPEAETKAEELAALHLTWHFIGQIQSNKAPRIAGYADVVHSVDSVRLAQRLNAGAHSRGRVIECFVQVSLDPVDQSARGRGGVVASELDEVADAVSSSEALKLCGVMGVAPLGGDAAEAYDRLAVISQRLRAGHPEATAISAGMTGDYLEAISAGATHVRVGSAILGERRPLR